LFSFYKYWIAPFGKGGKKKEKEAKHENLWSNPLPKNWH